MGISGPQTSLRGDERRHDTEPSGQVGLDLSPALSPLSVWFPLEGQVNGMLWPQFSSEK